MVLSEKSIFKLTVFIPLVSVVLLTGVLTYLIILYQSDFLDKEFKTEKNNYIQSQKEIIKDEVNRVFDLIKYKDRIAQKRLKKQIKNNSEIYNKLIVSIYEQYKFTKTNSEIINIIKLRLRDIRLTNESGYINIFDLNGIAIMLPIQDHYEDLSILNFRDKDNTFYIKNSIKIAKNHKSGYTSYYEVMPNTEQSEEFYKINYIKFFEPLGIVLSIGDYLYNIDKSTKEEVLQRANEIRFGKKGYIYIVSEDGKLLSHRDKKMIGVDAFKIKDINKKYYFKDGYNSAKKAGEAYIQYISSTNKNSKSMYNAKKLTFAKYSSKYKFVISAGIYIDDIDNVLMAKKIENKNKFEKFTIYIIIIAMILSFIVIFISFGLAVNIKKAFIKYRKTVKIKENELYKINSSLEEIIQQELEDKRKKDAQLVSQARFASLGEMIGNIAHQWRQPLSAISSISSGNIVQNQLGLLDSEGNNKSYEKILSHVTFLSKTIDDFRNYLIKSDDEKKEFDIQYTIEDILNIVEVAYKDNNIILVKDFVDLELKCFGSSSELSQVILNILNNAKDVLIQNNKDNKVVKITTLKLQNKNIIKIHDNAGGVPKKFMEKIFDPYFTTKHQSQGTGIGLYMSKDIIHNKFNGILEVENIEWDYNNKTVFGACFIIEI